jgi:hypothetical protein
MDLQEQKEQQEQQEQKEQDTLFSRIHLLIKDDPIFQSFQLNYAFYLVLLVCIALLAYYSHTSFIWAIITVILTSGAGYLSHYVSHKINALELFQQINKDNNYVSNTYAKSGIELFCKMIDFHDQTHHDTDINKNWENIAIEFATNFYVQAGGFILIVWIARQLNLYVIALWGLMYATIHNINYAIHPPATHMYHHIDKTTNYGIDIWDIIFNTKYGGDYSIDKIENINHYAINTAIITVAILLVMNVKVSVNIGF